LTGGPETIQGTATIGSIAAGSTQTAGLPIAGAAQNTPLTLEVTVNPVPGGRSPPTTASCQLTFH
jgi:hypothetical protein